MTEIQDVELWNQIKEKWKRGTKGGPAGLWSARKSQFAEQDYRAKGGRFIKEKKDGTPNVAWRKEAWGEIQKTAQRRKPATLAKK
jgi:hypothetical protein